jgi:hypothetical protein
VTRHYTEWNRIENDVSDGVAKLVDYCNAEWAGIEVRNHSNLLVDLTVS